MWGHERFPPGWPPVAVRLAALDRSLARRLQRARRAGAVQPDDGRRHRRDRRPDDPNRRPVAGRFRLLQLPRIRPRSRDHRGHPRVPREVGDASKLVADARQPRPLSADRGAPDRAARLRGRAGHPDDHPDPPVRDPRARRRRDDLRRQPGSQDDLRRLPVRVSARGDREAVPVRGSGRPGAAPAPGPLEHAADLHGRRQQHDRQRARAEGLRSARPSLRRDALRRRRPRVRRHRRARRERDEPLRHAREQHRPLLRRVVRPNRARRRLLQVVLVARGVRRLPDRAQEPAQDRRTAVPLLRAVADRLARDRACRLRRQRGPRRRDSRRPLAKDGPGAPVPRSTGRPHAESLRLPDHRGSARAPRGHRRGGALPLRPRRLRDARRLSARAEERGRVPDPGHGRQLPGRDRAAHRRPREACANAFDLRPAGRQEYAA